MSLYGYARGFDPRLGSLDPASCPQGRRLRGYSCGEGARGDGRQVLLDFLPAGDTLVVTRIDRLARLLKGPPGHRARAQGQGCCFEGDRSAGWHRGRQGVFRHARCVRRIRDQSAPRAPIRGDHRRQGAVSTRAASRRSMPPRCCGCTARKSWAPWGSHAGSVYAGPASIA